MNVYSFDRGKKLDNLVSLLMVGVLSAGVFVGGLRLYKDVPRIYRDIERGLNYKYSSQINL